MGLFALNAVADLKWNSGTRSAKKFPSCMITEEILFINWAERPSVQDIAAVMDAWGPDESDHITYHYERGVELVGCVPRYNPFDGSDHTHLAAFEHLRTARDLLKKTGKSMKQNGSGPDKVKRLFQSLKLTESALRHARRCQAVDNKNDVEEST